MGVTPLTFRFLLIPTGVTGEKMSATELVEKTVFKKGNFTEYILRTFPKDPGPL